MPSVHGNGPEDIGRVRASTLYSRPSSFEGVTGVTRARRRAVSPGDVSIGRAGASDEERLVAFSIGGAGILEPHDVEPL